MIQIARLEKIGQKFNFFHVIKNCKLFPYT
jgi:hypothetical protein